MEAAHRDTTQQTRDESALASAASSGRADGVDPTDEIQERVRRRAYELYCSRGAGFGNELDDWLEAEREIRTKRDAE